jgi:hypothetical protein
MESFFVSMAVAIVLLTVGAAPIYALADRFEDRISGVCLGIVYGWIAGFIVFAVLK